MKKLILLMFVVVLSTTLINADYLPHQKDTDLSFSVTSNNATQCNVTTYNYPNGVAVINKIMEKDGQTFNITIDKGNFSFSGNYCFNILCTDNINIETGSVCREVNESGNEVTIVTAIFNLGAIIILLFIIILFAVLFYKHEELWVKTFCFYVIYGLFIVINYLGYVIFSQYFWVASFVGAFFKWLFIIQLILVLPLVMGSLIYYTYILILNKQIKHMVDRGMPIDEAYGRSVKSGMKYFRGRGYERL